MNKYTFFSEKQALKEEMLNGLRKYTDSVLSFYLANGFDALVLNLKMGEDWQRRIVFDFLMLENKAVLKCITQNKAFFLKIIAEGKGHLIRSMLGLSSKKYQSLWREALDLLHLYHIERQVDDKLFNLSLEKFFENSILNEQKESEE